MQGSPCCARSCPLLLSPGVAASDVVGNAMPSVMRHSSHTHALPLPCHTTPPQGAVCGWLRRRRQPHLRQGVGPDVPPVPPEDPGQAHLLRRLRVAHGAQGRGGWGCIAQRRRAQPVPLWYLTAAWCAPRSPHHTAGRVLRRLPVHAVRRERGRGQRQPGCVCTVLWGEASDTTRSAPYDADAQANILSLRLPPLAFAADWRCPMCRDLCNCSFHRSKRGWAPTGTLYRHALAEGAAGRADRAPAACLEPGLACCRSWPTHPHPHALPLPPSCSPGYLSCAHYLVLNNLSDEAKSVALERGMCPPELAGERGGAARAWLGSRVCRMCLPGAADATAAAAVAALCCSRAEERD